MTERVRAGVPASPALPSLWPQRLSQCQIQGLFDPDMMAGVRNRTQAAERRPLLSASVELEACGFVPLAEVDFVPGDGPAGNDDDQVGAALQPRSVLTGSVPLGGVIPGRLPFGQE